MSSFDEERALEERIQESGCVAPRITPEHIDEQIAKVQFYQFPDTLVIGCCITLVNGFNVLGHSACASPENEDIGKDIAFKNARDKIWELEGYALRDWLMDQKAAQVASQALADQDASIETSEAEARPFPIGGPIHTPVHKVPLTVAGRQMQAAVRVDDANTVNVTLERHSDTPIVSGQGGDFGGGGASGSWDNPTETSSGAECSNSTTSADF